ncbi:cyclic nucleotide-binding domain-containing protein [Pseudochelatococcus lubricantis]|uniref:cyclic nucleotide-binding domain-containing protein n=1 Tax=Pseudochelatococcus lubricantis TaxID=1538102 RepID=UPI0035EB6F4F
MALNDEITVLSSLPALRGFEQGALRRIALSVQTRILRAGDTLYRRGEAAEGAYVVMSGEIALVDAAGNTVALARPGDMLGELALLIEIEWRETATARRSASVMRVSRALMRRILGEFPASAAAFQAEIAGRVSALSGELERVRQSLLALDGAAPGGDETMGAAP